MVTPLGFEGLRKNALLKIIEQNGRAGFYGTEFTGAERKGNADEEGTFPC